MLQQSYYLAAKQLLPVTPPWGALAGVRPTKITTKHLLEGGSPKSADRLLRDVYYVTGDRRRLAVDCSVSTVRAVNLLQSRDLSLYVGIPFCPTRCTYCSFVSRTIGRKTELLEPYLRALEQEIAVTGKLLAQSRENRPHPLHRRRHTYDPFRPPDGAPDERHPGQFRPVPVYRIPP